VAQGHELGCHTFSHVHAENTPPEVFEEEVVRNRIELQRYLPGSKLETLSYPIGVPRADTKRRVSKYFSCCRCGGQTFNKGTMDLNFLSAFFLEKCREDLGAIKEVIDQNQKEKGWLILATHDVCEHPTPFGCTPTLFEEVVKYAMASGARIMPVSSA